MGKYDSSKYRITPLLVLISSSSQHFKKIHKCFGHSWTCITVLFLLRKKRKSVKTHQRTSEQID